MINELLPYIPVFAKEPLTKLINQYNFRLKIVNGRKTKRGDFRATKPLPIITINNNLSKEQFLITLVHEIAHLETYLHFPKAKAHGKQWKQSFKHLMLPFLNNKIFDDDLLKLLANHLINAKATTDSDPALAIKLLQTNNNIITNNYFIFDLKPGSLFMLNNRTFKLIKKRRTRYECEEIATQKKYLINGSAPVKQVS